MDRNLSSQHAESNVEIDKLLAIYVITTKSLPDRHKHIDKMLSSLGLRYEYIWKYDVPDINEKDLSRIDPNLPLRSISCLLKHLEAQRLLMGSGLNLALVLEDDCIFYPNFKKQLVNLLEYLNKIDSKYLVFLGGGDNKLDEKFLFANPNSLVESPMTTAEAYIIDRAGCQMRLDWIATNLISLPADHFLKYIDQKLGIKHYRPAYPLATQGSITGKFGTTLDDSRARKSPIFLNLRYKWNRFRNQFLRRIINRFIKIIKHCDK